MQAYVIATFKQKQYFIVDKRDILRSKKRFLLKILATGMYEIVRGLTHWPPEIEADMVARLSKFRLTPYGSDPYVHRDGIRKRNYMSRKYSLIIPPPTALENEYHTFLRDYLSSARRKRSAPRHFFPNIYHLQLHEGNDQVKKWGREVSGSFVMFQLVFCKFLRRDDGHVGRGNSNGTDD